MTSPMIHLVFSDTIKNFKGVKLRLLVGRETVQKHLFLFCLTGSRKASTALSLAKQSHCRWRIEFWPRRISTGGVLIQRAVLRIQWIFHVEFRPPRQGVIVLRPLRRIKFGPLLNCDPEVLIPRWIMTPGLDSTLKFYPESWFNIELWPGIWITIQCGIVTRGHNSTWNFDPGSKFNVEFWARVTIQREILSQGHNSTWNSDPSTYLLPVEFRLKKVSKFNSVIKIQQLKRVTIQRKIHWILTLGRYSIGGGLKFYLTQALHISSLVESAPNRSFRYLWFYT